MDNDYGYAADEDDTWDFGDSQKPSRQPPQAYVHRPPKLPPGHKQAPWANDPAFKKPTIGYSAGQSASGTPAGYEDSGYRSKRSGPSQARAGGGLTLGSWLQRGKAATTEPARPTAGVSGAPAGGELGAAPASAVGGGEAMRGRARRGNSRGAATSLSRGRAPRKCNVGGFGMDYTPEATRHPKLNTSSTPSGADVIKAAPCSLSGIAQALTAARPRAAPAGEEEGKGEEAWDALTTPATATQARHENSRHSNQDANIPESSTRHSGENNARDSTLHGFPADECALNSGQAMWTPDTAAEYSQPYRMTCDEAVFEDPPLDDLSDLYVDPEFCGPMMQLDNYGAANKDPDNETAASYQLNTSSSNAMDNPYSEVEHIIRSNPSLPESWLRHVLLDDGKATSRFQDANVPSGTLWEHREWLKRLESSWSDGDKRRQYLTGTVLRECFHSVPNPFITALYLCEEARDYSSSKNATLSLAVMRELQQFAGNREGLFERYVTPDIQREAFRISSMGSQFLLDIAITVYRLETLDGQSLLPKIESLFREHKYKEAAHCISRLALHDHYDIRDVCLPLLLMDNVNLVENYVSQRHQQQVALLQLLDELVDHDTDWAGLSARYAVEKVKRDKLTPKVLSKLAVRLMKLYQISPETCPSISRDRSLRALRYLLYKKYVELTVDGHQWIELVQGSVGESTWLQGQLVDLLVSWHDLPEAARWAKHYRVSPDLIPDQISDMVHLAEDLETSGDQSREQDGGQETGGDIRRACHRLSLPEDRILWVADREAFTRAVDQLCQPGNVVGVDAEWKPSFSQTNPMRLALLQLATRDAIYLLDILELLWHLTEAEWSHFAESLFCNANVLKLGYGIDGDLQMLVKSIPKLKEPLDRMQRVVDIQSLQQSLKKLCPDLFDRDSGGALVAENGGPDDHYQQQQQQQPEVTEDARFTVLKAEERGLSDLVRQCLGRPLDKLEQMSDWERRPLRPQQAVYAALDAFCLLEVYEVLTLRAKQRNIRVNLEPTVSRLTKKKKSRLQRLQQKVAEKPKETPQVTPDPPRQSGTPLASSVFRVVCDTMLQGLGRHLRCCGVDVVVLDNNDDHEMAADIARREERVVLTSGAPYMTLRHQVASGMCFNVSPGKAKQQVQQVLDHFNVKVTTADIFSRCQVCNGNSYTHVSPADMAAAWHRKAALTPSSQGETYPDRSSHPGSTSSSSSSGSGSKGAAKAKATAIATPTAASVATPATVPTTTSLAHFSKGMQRPGNEDDSDCDKLELDLETLTLGVNGVSLKVEDVPEGLLDKVDLFYVCRTCGKVFWEGSHFERVVQQFSHVLTSDGAEQNIYQTVKKEGGLAS